MTTNVWVSQEWQDSSLRWNPKDFGNVEMIHVPANSIWNPDIVLYNTLDAVYISTIHVTHHHRHRHQYYYHHHPHCHHRRHHLYHLHDDTHNDHHHHNHHHHHDHPHHYRG